MDHTKPFLIFLLSGIAVFSSLQVCGQERKPGNAEFLEAKYPGGDVAWMLYLAKNLRIPEDYNHNYSTARLKFLVKKNGTVSHVTFLSGDPEMKTQMINLVQNSGRWTPAWKHKRPVKSEKAIQIIYCARAE